MMIKWTNTSQWLVYAVVLIGVATAHADDPQRIAIDGVAGLRFDPVRFVVQPGQEVELEFRNLDTMMHNLLIVDPGTREAVADAAMGAGMQAHYVPDMDEVLWATEVIAADEVYMLRFTAPDQEGAYPYVCTFPGHATMMFGVMHVLADADDMPELADDPDVPKYARELVEDAQVATGHDPDDAPRRKFRRTWVRDAGPSAMGVHAGGNLSYVWDADTNHLRYAWYNGFMDSERHWTGNQSDFTEIQGHIYYRAGRDFPIRLGDPSHVPVREFGGYRIIDGLPQFEFTIDGYEVRQYITALDDEPGLRMNFQMQRPDQPVYFVVDPDAGADFRSSAGDFHEGVLELTPEQAFSFDVELVERPGHEPMGYWSMNDDPWTAFNNDRARPGVVGRSLHFANHEKNTGVTGGQVEVAMTFAGWVQFQNTEGRQFVFGQRDVEDDRQFAIMLENEQLMMYYVDEHGEQACTALDNLNALDAWNHVMWTRSSGKLSVYVNGEQVVDTRTGPLLDEQSFRIGGHDGDDRVNAHLDEFRLWGRVLSDLEREAFYDQQASWLEEH